MCIYYNNKENLTYTGQEHIFPASIGGIEKLPLGYVSDQANNYFSRLEQNLLKFSMVSLSREIFGPGKRGTNKLGEVNVYIMKDDNDEYALGYIFKGKPYTIPHINVNTKTGKVHLSLDKKEGSQYINIFLHKLESFKEKFVYIKNSAISQDEILIGYYQNKYFVASFYDEIEISKIRSIIKAFLQSMCKNAKYENKKSQVCVTNAMTISKDNAKVYAKIALNVLAKYKGKDYVLNPAFDDMRKWVIGEKDLNITRLPSRNNNLNFLISELIGHYCVITDINGYICTEVSIYGWKHYFKLGKNPGEKFVMPLGIFCDFKNKKEYTLEEIFLAFTKSQY